MSKKLFSLASLLIVVAMLLAACGATPEPQVIEKVVTQVVEKTVKETVVVEGTPQIVEKVVTEVVEKPVEVEKVVTATPKPGGVFAGAYPYQVPPVGHFNMFATNAINIGIYQDLFQPSMFIYQWADGTWRPLLGTEYTIDQNAATLTVKLREGVKWSNGDDFTAQDVLVTFNCRRLAKGTVWRYLSKVEAPDDHTVVFTMSQPSSVVQRYVLRNERIVDRATYGEWADKAQALVDQGLTVDSDEWNTLLQQFNEFRPEAINATGPYVIDPNSINEARLTLTKNPTSWLADTVKFDEVYIYNGETPTVTPLVLAKQVDYATHGFPPATEKAFVSEGIRILRPPIYSGPALYFNMTIYPFNVKEVRQALAYAIDRNENGTVSLGDSGKAVQYMAGFSDNIVPLWVDDPSALNTYAYDTAKAEQMLTDLGFSKGSDGVWVTDKGDRMEYELTAPAEYADWSAAAENAAEQLTAFGIPTTFRGVEFRQHPIDVNHGDFQLAIRGWGAGDPNPHFSFVQDLYTHNGEAVTGAALSADPNLATQGPGMSFPLTQQTDCCGEFNFETNVDSMPQGLDVAAQKAMVNETSLAYNEVLPQIQLWERYGNNPAMDGLHTCGWPADSDPIYKNSPYADSFTVMMILDGTLYPCNQ